MIEYRGKHERLEAYVDRRMIEGERNALEAAAETDTELAEQLELHRHVQAALTELDRREQRALIAAIWEQDRPVEQRQRWATWGIGIGVAFVGIALILLMLRGPRTPDDSVRIHTRTAPPAQIESPAAFAQRAFIPPTLENFAANTSGWKAYRTGKYDRVLREFELEEGPGTQLARAVSYLALDRPQDAIGELRPLLGHESRYVRQEASWLLAQSLFRQQRLIEAFGLTEQIARTPGHSYELDAQRWLETLKQAD